MPDIMHSPEFYVCYVLFSTHTPIIKLNLLIRHSKRVTATNNKVEKLKQYTEIMVM